MAIWITLVIFILTPACGNNPYADQEISVPSQQADRDANQKVTTDENGSDQQVDPPIFGRSDFLDAEIVNSENPGPTCLFKTEKESKLVGQTLLFSLEISGRFSHVDVIKEQKNIRTILETDFDPETVRADGKTQIQQKSSSVFTESDLDLNSTTGNIVLTARVRDANGDENTCEKRVLLNSQTVQPPATAPTASPTTIPFATPTPSPTATPITSPTTPPTPSPTATPIPRPTATPTPRPTATPIPRPTTNTATSGRCTLSITSPLDRNVLQSTNNPVAGLIQIFKNTPTDLIVSKNPTLTLKVGNWSVPHTTYSTASPTSWSYFNLKPFNYSGLLPLLTSSVVTATLTANIEVSNGEDLQCSNTINLHTTPTTASCEFVDPVTFLPLRTSTIILPRLLTGQSNVVNIADHLLVKIAGSSKRPLVQFATNGTNFNGYTSINPQNGRPGVWIAGGALQVPERGVLAIRAQVPDSNKVCQLVFVRQP